MVRGSETGWRKGYKKQQLQTFSQLMVSDEYDAWISYTHLGKRKAINVLPPKGETDARRVANIIQGLVGARYPETETGAVVIRTNWSKDPTEEDYNNAEFVALDCLDKHIERNISVEALGDYSPYLFTIWF